MSRLENHFESGTRKVIPATLVYILRAGQVLMIHRGSPSRASDFHSGKWNGLGGKCELDESPLQAAKREVMEESGLALSETSFVPLGVIQFPNFKPHKSEDWMVFVFTANLGNEPTDLDLKPSDEGTLHWVPLEKLDTLNLWPGDRLFLDRVKKGTPFIGTIWYEDSKVSRHWIADLGIPDS